MATNPDTPERILNHVARMEGITSRKMFGEYSLFYNKKNFALVCDDKLFIKQTPEGIAFAGNYGLAPPYPGAKPAILIPEPLPEPEWLIRLITITVDALPEPARKKKKESKKSSLKKKL
ncbi:MAG: TfoX/Sxy family protein [Bacteroidales bacterium]